MQKENGTSTRFTKKLRRKAKMAAKRVLRELNVESSKRRYVLNFNLNILVQH